MTDETTPDPHHDATAIDPKEQTWRLTMQAHGQKLDQEKALLLVQAGGFEAYLSYKYGLKDATVGADGAIVRPPRDEPAPVVDDPVVVSDAIVNGEHVFPVENR